MRVKVKLLTTMAGPAGCYSPGMVVDLPAEDADDLIAGDFAVSIESETEISGRSKVGDEQSKVTASPAGKNTAKAGKHAAKG